MKTGLLYKDLLHFVFMLPTSLKKYTLHVVIPLNGHLTISQKSRLLFMTLQIWATTRQLIFILFINHPRPHKGRHVRTNVSVPFSFIENATVCIMIQWGVSVRFEVKQSSCNVKWFADIVRAYNGTDFSRVWP